MARPRPASLTSRERIVAAGVEHDDAHPACNGVQRAHQVDQSQRIAVEIVRRRDLGIDRKQIVLALDLHAVTGIVDHGDGAGAALGDLGGKVLHDPDHVFACQVGRWRHLEAGRVQELRHRLRVVAGIGELRRGLVVRIADHQRDALVRRRWRLHAGADVGVGGFGESCAGAEAQQACQETGAQAATAGLNREHGCLLRRDAFARLPGSSGEG